MANFDDFIEALSGEDFDEKPVEIEEFVTSEEFLGLPPLSHYQYQIIKVGSQIYRYDTLVYLYGEEKARKRWDETCNEVVLQLGKGSGKDYTSVIACCYIVYLLLCLKDPAKYYGQPPDDAIDIVNIAVNAEQANRVFFSNLVKRVKRCPWFVGKFEPTKNAIEFSKNVRVFSGHSEREAFEGLNLLVAVLDEISAFALENTTGNKQAKTAHETYLMYRDSVDSRFSEFGKVLLLSFPRFKDDYIQQRYDAIIAEKETLTRVYTLKLDQNLPAGIEGNEFDVEWEEDHIIRYRYQKMFALRRPSWEVNPTKNIEMYTRNFYENMGNALGKFACMPTNLEDGYFKNKDLIDETFKFENGIDRFGAFLDSFRPKPDTQYYVHVDLAQVHDRCAIAMAHVDSWENISYGADEPILHPVIKVDLLKFWEPTKEKSVDFDEVRNFIVEVRNRGFKINLCTFDRWNSHDSRNILEHEHGIKTDTLSVAAKHYDDFLGIMTGRRLRGPDEKKLRDELKELRLIKNKVDHPRAGFKDLSDAVCGAIFNAVTYTPKPVDMQVRVRTLADLAAEERDAQREAAQRPWDGIIRPPRRNTEEMQPEVARFLQSLKVM